MPSSKWMYFFMGLVLAYFAKIVFIPLFLSIFSAILLEPLVLAVAQKTTSRHLATILVITSFVATSAFCIWLTYLSLVTLASGSAGMSEHIGNLSSWLQGIATKVEAVTHTHAAVVKVGETVQKVQIVDAYPSWTNYIINGVGSLSEIATLAFFVPLLLFYFLYDKENLLESFNSLIGQYCYLPKLNSELPKMIRAYVTANLITLSLLLIWHGLTLYFLNFNNWIPLTMITAVVSLIPLVGGPVSILLPLSQGVTHGEVAFPFIALAISLSAIHIVASNLILPQLTGSRINVNTSALILGLLFWGWLWGAMGFVLAVPMTALIKIFLESNPETIPLANLLAAKPRHIIPSLEQMRHNPKKLKTT